MRETQLTISAAVFAITAASCSAFHETNDGDGGGIDMSVADASALDASRDATEDAAPDLGPPMWMSCEMAATGGAQTGDTCLFAARCGSVDICCGIAWSCPGEIAAAVGDCSRDQVSSCPALAGVTDVHGDTPLGPVSFSFAWASYSRALAVDLIVQLGTTPSFFICASPRLGIYLSPTLTADGTYTYVGSHRRLVTLWLGTERATVNATVTITNDASAGGAIGSITITAPGWSLTGTFQAPECADVDRSGP